MLFLLKSCVPRRRKRFLSLVIAFSAMLVLFSLKLHYDEKELMMKLRQESQSGYSAGQSLHSPAINARDNEEEDRLLVGDGTNQGEQGLVNQDGQHLKRDPDEPMGQNVRNQGAIGQGLENGNNQENVQSAHHIIDVRENVNENQLGIDGGMGGENMPAKDDEPQVDVVDGNNDRNIEHVQQQQQQQQQVQQQAVQQQEVQQQEVQQQEVQQQEAPRQELQQQEVQQQEVQNQELQQQEAQQQEVQQQEVQNQEVQQQEVPRQDVHPRPEANIEQVHQLQHKIEQRQLQHQQLAQQREQQQQERLVQQQQQQMVQQQQQEQQQLVQQQQQRKRVVNVQGMPIIVDAIYWSPEVERMVPPGIPEATYQRFRREISEGSVVSLEKPSWLKCGRPPNQYAHLADGTAMCARYRKNHAMVYGEILSFALSRILGLDNVPLIVLSRVDTSTGLWRKVAGQVEGATWQQGNLVALIRWIDQIDPNNRDTHRIRAFMPPLLLDCYERKRTLTWREPGLLNATETELHTLLQWSDLIVFDYITGNYDRVASMQDAAEKENKPSIMHEPMRNLPISPDGKLWLIDNECGMQDAYLLLSNPRFVKFHRQMLRSTCMFRRRTVEGVRKLATAADPNEELLRHAHALEPLFDEGEQVKAAKILRRRFQSRLQEVLDWVEECAKMQ